MKQKSEYPKKVIKLVFLRERKKNVESEIKVKIVNIIFSLKKSPRKELRKIPPISSKQTRRKGVFRILKLIHLLFQKE